jgi:hypothetical protein
MCDRLTPLNPRTPPSFCAHSATYVFEAPTGTSYLISKPASASLLTAPHMAHIDPETLYPHRQHFLSSSQPFRPPQTTSSITENKFPHTTMAAHHFPHTYRFYYFRTYADIGSTCISCCDRELYARREADAELRISRAQKASRTNESGAPLFIIGFEGFSYFSY